MLKRVVHSLGLVDHTDENPRRRNKVRGGTKASPDFGLRSKDSVVRIVLQGGQQEVYQHPLPSSKLMAKYPGMFVAKPEVFKAPHQSLLLPQELLLLGHKYIMISSRDLEKLKLKHQQQDKTKELNDVVETPEKTLETRVTSRSPRGHKNKEIVDTRITLSPNECKTHEKGEVKEAKMILSQGGEDVEESYCSAKDFYVPPKDKSTRYSRRRGIKGKKKPFVPPLPKARLYRGLGWQPSLATVHELSP